MSQQLRRLLAGFAALGLMAVIAVGCGDDKADTASPGSDTPASAKIEGSTIVIGTQDFPESELLGQVYGQALTNAGYSVEYKKLGGFRDLVLAAFDSGEISFTPEYAASLLETVNENAGEASGDIDATFEKLTAALKPLDLTALTPSPAADSNGLAVTKETSESKGLTKISQLTADLKLGGPQNCKENPFCIPGLQRVYDVDLSASFTPLDGGGPLTVKALSGGEIDVAVLFTTSAAAKPNGFVFLQDDKSLFNADNITPVVANATATEYGNDMVTLVNKISAAMTTEKLLAMNDQFENEKLDAAEVAATFLKDNGLLK